MTIRTLKGLLAAAFLACLADTSAAMAQTASIAGIWQTSGGRMELTQNDTEINGPYDQDDGRIFGTLTGNVLQGIWVEHGSNVTCAEPRDGSLHWGPITFAFNGDFTAFSGRWEYCDGTGGNAWTGQLVEHGKLTIE